MAACYFMGGSSGTGKKSGRWFGFFRLLHLDQYGAPAIDNFWFDDAETFKNCIAEVDVGFPVIVSVDAGTGKISSVHVRDDIPPLDLRL